MKTPTNWPDDLPVAQVRFARPTGDLSAILKFYREGLGLKEVAGFREHAGYSGVMLGLPGKGYHLEFTQHEDDGPCQAPTEDNLLVFYLGARAARDRVATKLRDLGFRSVPAENPYWNDQGITFEDPEGWRVVLMATAGI